MRVPSVVTAGRSRSLAYSAWRFALSEAVAAERRQHRRRRPDEHRARPPVDEQLVAVGDRRPEVADAADDRHPHRAGDDGDVRGQRAFFEDDALEEPAVVFEQFGGAEVARQDDGIADQPRPRGTAELARDDADQAIAEVVEVGQPLAQIGVGDRPHARAGPLLDALDRRFGGQARIDRLVDPPRPALVVGKHLVRLEHLGRIAAGELGLAHHAVDLLAHPDEGTIDARAFGLGVVGDRVFDDDARLVEHRGAARQPVDQLEAGQADGAARRTPRLGGGDVVDQPGAGDQFGQHHRHRLQHLDLDLGIVARLGVLDAEHPDGDLAADDRHAGERVEDLLAGLGLEREVGVRPRLGEVQGLARRRNHAGQPFAEREAGDMDRRLRKAPGRKEFEDAVAQQVDRRDLAIELLGDDRDDGVELGLRAGRRRHDVVQLAQDLARRGNGGHQPRPASAASASATSSAMMSATGATQSTMPTDWPAISEPCSTSPSTTARRRAPAQ